ncbi:cytochrome P450 [Nocardia otitidiscaviarum]|uniref:cytochrome P450 n=1 Tax=Nocardia otitidiscaviarum TaxID=1823 RepID=UPI0005BBD7BE|nr:cytochrome P450 [Nocardia otitidiscaviarum]MBF6137619.1 cytochrome P450 [Nocardia otitidiscaviarum]MBF6488527.1 cytochrome P450 [Nocardia otitidiscaviarum]
MGSTASPASTSIPTAPGSLPILGHSVALLREPWHFLASLPALGSDLVRIRMGPYRVVVVCDPGLTRQVLRNDQTFDKGGPLFDVARDTIGNSVITAPHSAHRQQRRRIQGPFHAPRLPLYAAEMTREVDAVTARWHGQSKIEVASEMMRLTTRGFLAAMFSVSISPAALDQALADVTVIVDGLYRQLVLPRRLRGLPTPANLRYRAARASLRRLVDQVIGARRKSSTEFDDLLSALLAEHDRAEGATPSGSTMYEQLTALFIAGSETTASALSWALYLLATHPETLAAMQTETDRVLPEGLARHEYIAALDLTRRVLAETLRLYPPGWLFTRVVTADSQLGEYFLAAGTPVIYSPYLLHRLDGEYRDAGRFDPDRWVTGSAPTSYVPFGAGPRRCAGEQFALTEATLALATIVRRWQLRPCSDEPLRPAVAMALRPRRFHIAVTERMR